jgi:hypothetical protein
MANNLETTPGFVPFTTVAFKGVSTINGAPVNRSNAGYKTVGGIIDGSDSNNSGLTASFGVVVSSLPANESGLFVIGKPAGYLPVGVLMFDAGIAQNDPAKSDYFLQNLPVTAIYEGTVRYQSWTKTQTGSIDPIKGCQIIYRTTTGGTAGCAIGAIEFLPAGQAIPTSFASFPGYVVEVTSQFGVEIEMNFDNSADNEIAALLPYGVPFVKTVTITSSAAATAVPIIPDTAVPAGKKVYVTGFIGKVNGATVWATTATVAVQDTAGSPVAGITCAVAAMTANALLGLNTANVTVAAPVSTGVGFTAAKGISLKGDANGTGSDFVVTVTGYIA